MFGRNYKGVFSRMGEGLLEKLVEELKEELKRKPDDPEILYKLGIGYVRLGKIDSAREVYKKLKDIDPDRAKDLLDNIYDF